MAHRIFIGFRVLKVVFDIVSQRIAYQVVGATGPGKE